MAEQAYKWWEDHDAAYDVMRPKWDTVMDIYSCDPDIIRESNRYIIHKKQGEHADNYSDRLALAKVVPLLATVADGYTGRMENAKVARTFSSDEGEGLGSIDDMDTIAGRIWLNADGRGMNYLPLLSDVATDLTLKTMVWGLVEGVRRDERGNAVSDASIRVIPAERVPITLEDKFGNLIAAVVNHDVNVRESVFEPNDVRDRFTVYMLDGYATYEIQEVEKTGANGRKYVEEEAVRVDGGEGDDPIPYGGVEGEPFKYYDTSDKNESDLILPIFRVGMLVKRYPAYTLASQNVVYINHASELQSKHRTCNLIRLQVVTKGEDDRKANEQSMKEGSPVFWIPADASRDNKFIEPDATSLRETREWLRDTFAEFLFSALREYENSVQGSQKTATEAAQDAAQGEHSYLNMLAGALDEFESQAWKRIEQIEFPNEPDKWGQFSVKRKRDFKPMDANELGTKLRGAYFGLEPVPVGTKGRVSAAMMIADADDIEYEEEEIRAEVEAKERDAAAFGLVEDEFGLNV